MPPLYSLQWAACDSGLIAHFGMPKRADGDVKWLIADVMLPRVQNLSCPRNIGLTAKIRKIIEGGPPSMAADNFERPFSQEVRGHEQSNQNNQNNARLVVAERMLEDTSSCRVTFEQCAECIDRKRSGAFRAAWPATMTGCCVQCRLHHTAEAPGWENAPPCKNKEQRA